MFVQTKPLAGVAALALFAFASPASAATLIQYNFNGTPGNQAAQDASFEATGLDAVSFTRGSGLGANVGSDSLNSNGWGAYATNPNDYLTFGFNVLSGYTASVNQLVFGSRRSNTGPSSFSVLASVDGGDFATIGAFTATGSRTNSTINFDALTGTSSLVFRIVSNATAPNNGTFRVENASNSPFSINGDVAQIPVGVVPEPATWAMMIGGIGLAGGALRRRRSVSVRFA